MTFSHLTWYLLEDGTHADPDDVAPDDHGVLRHKNGLAVALRENGDPMSIGASAVENQNVEAAGGKVMQPSAPKRGYKTREAKAR